MFMCFKTFSGQNEKNCSGRTYNFSLFEYGSLATIYKCYLLRRNWQFMN